MANESMKKKILFVTESLARGGMERVLVDITNALSIRGYDVTIIAYHETDYLRNELNPEVTYQYVNRREMIKWVSKDTLVPSKNY